MMFVKNKEPFLIGVAGGISSGKSSVCKKIIEELGKLNSSHKKHVFVISLDSFYKPLSGEDLAKAERGELNLDHPDSYDDELAYKVLTDLIQGRKVRIPVYDKKLYRIKEDFIEVDESNSPDVVIIEGILTFYYPQIRDLCQMKLFVDCDADTRLSRRVTRDLQEYKRPLDHVLNYYQKFVKPAFEEFCLPTKKYADVIIPRGSENMVAINLIVQHINDILNAKNASTTSSEVTIASNGSSSASLSANANLSSGSLRSPIAAVASSPSNQQSPRTPSKRSEPSSRPH